jgi:hypothetical protein
MNLIIILIFIRNLLVISIFIILNELFQIQMFSSLLSIGCNLKFFKFGCFLLLFYNLFNLYSVILSYFLLNTLKTSVNELSIS